LVVKRLGGRRHRAKKTATTETGAAPDVTASAAHQVAQVLRALPGAPVDTGDLAYRVIIIGVHAMDRAMTAA